MALDLGRTVRAGLRVNLDAGIYPQWSRFGLNLESGQALDAVKRISVLKRIELTSLHCHLGTFILDPNAYAVQVTKLAQFAQELEKGFAVKITTLDIGGGLPSRSRLKGTYHAPELSIPSLDTYAEKITDALYRALGPGRPLASCSRAGAPSSTRRAGSSPRSSPASGFPTGARLIWPTPA